MNSHEVLVKARNLLDREGWGRLYQTYRVAPRCAMGGIWASGGFTSFGDWDAGTKGAKKALAAVIGCPSIAGDIGAWNDHPDRTAEEVLAAFDEAIRRTAPEPLDPFASAPLDFSPEAVAMP